MKVKQIVVHYEDGTTFKTWPCQSYSVGPTKDHGYDKWLLVLQCPKDPPLPVLHQETAFKYTRTYGKDQVNEADPAPKTMNELLALWKNVYEDNLGLRSLEPAKPWFATVVYPESAKLTGSYSYGHYPSPIVK